MFDNMTEKQKELFAFINESWKEKMSELEALNPQNFNFAVQSDTHYSTLNPGNTANNIKALSHLIPLAFYANLGDYIKGYFMGEAGKSDNTPELTMTSLKELTARYLDGASCPVLITFGNHDTNALWCKNYGKATQQLTKKDHYEQVISKVKAHNGQAMVNDGESNYYYVDFPADGVRMIMLNTTDGNYEESFDSTTVIGERQLEWFEKVALDTKFHIIVASHIPFYKEFPGNDGAPKNAECVLSAVENFIKSGGNFVAYLCGHNHIQADMVDVNGRLHVSFKNGGHIAEVLSIDTKKREINTVGLGKIESRSFKY